MARLGNSLLKWQFTYSTSTRDEPDLREVNRSPNADGSLAFIATPQSGLRFTNGLEDRIYEPLVELGIPFYKGGFSGIIKTGFRGTFRDREFRSTPVPLYAGSHLFAKSPLAEQRTVRTRQHSSRRLCPSRKHAGYGHLRGADECLRRFHTGRPRTWSTLAPHWRFAA